MSTSVFESGLRALALSWLVFLGPGEAARATPAASPAEVSRFARSSNALGLDLYHTLSRTTGNLAFSPFAVESSLAMLERASGGETNAQIRRVMHVEGPADAALATASDIADGFAGLGRRYELVAAQRLFVDGGRAHGAPRGQLLASFVEPLDFSSSEGAASRINAWAASGVGRRFGEVVSPSAITSSTSFVIASAVYFRGPWKRQFSKADTAPRPFYRTPADPTDVPTMHISKGAFEAASVDGVSLLELPYAGDRLAMILAIPEGELELASVEARLSPEALDRWFAALRPEVIDVFVPRFRVEATFPLEDALKSAGMSHAFDGAVADFTPIASRGVSVDVLSQHVYLEVNEEGTMAWAMNLGFGKKAAPDEIRADRPFLFFLRDSMSGLILFMGRVSDPLLGAAPT